MSGPNRVHFPHLRVHHYHYNVRRKRPVHPGWRKLGRWLTRQWRKGWCYPLLLCGALAFGWWLRQPYHQPTAIERECVLMGTQLDQLKAALYNQEATRDRMIKLGQAWALYRRKC